MTRKPGKVIRAAQIQSERAAYRQRLNPRSRFEGSELSRPAGMEKLGVSIAWLKPGEESFAFHAHMVEEEWLYMLSGRAVVEMADERVEVGPGDFVSSTFSSASRGSGPLSTRWAARSTCSVPRTSSQFRSGVQTPSPLASIQIGLVIANGGIPDCTTGQSANDCRWLSIGPRTVARSQVSTVTGMG